MIAWRAKVGWALAAITFVAAFAFSYGPGALRMSLWPALFTAAAAAFTVWLSGVRPVAALVAMVIVTVLLAAIDTTFDAMALVIVLVGFQAAMRSDLLPGVLTWVWRCDDSVPGAHDRLGRRAGSAESTGPTTALRTRGAAGRGSASGSVRRAT